MYRFLSNLTALSRLGRNGRKVGKPRFNGKDRFRTITYNQSGSSFERKSEKRTTIHLSKIGEIRVKTHREIAGKIRQVIVKGSAGRWYIILQTDGSRTDPTAGNGVIGIDLGIEFYLTQDNSMKVIDRVSTENETCSISALMIPILWFLGDQTSEARAKVKSIIREVRGCAPHRGDSASIIQI